MATGNSYQQIIYYNSPFFIKNLISSFYGVIQKKDRYGKFYIQYINKLSESQWWDNSKLIEFQFNKVKDFLIHAHNHSEYYKNIFLKYNFNPYKMQSLSDLAVLPLINKDMIRKNVNKFVVDNLVKYKVHWTHTSGTTGQALNFPLSQECFQREHAFRTIHYSWGNIKLGNKIAVCAGHPVAFHDQKKPPFWTYDYSNKWLLLSSYHLTEDNLSYYIDEIAKFSPDLLKGYPSSIYLLAVANSYYGKKIKPNAVYTASETLLDFQRKIIEESFECKVYVWYGTGEMCGNIVECEKGRLHLKYEHSFIEILDQENKSINPNEDGRLICTGFGNYAMPLIRYDIGDIAVKSTEEFCPCGRGGVLIDRIIGRVEDYIITPDGRFVGRLDHLFKDSITIKEAQIIQNSADEILIKIVPLETNYKVDEKQVIKEAKLRLGTQIKISFEYVKEIPRLKSGKFKFIVSNIEKKKLYDSII